MAIASSQQGVNAPDPGQGMPIGAGQSVGRTRAGTRELASIAIGSNIGDRSTHIARGLELLGKSDHTRVLRTGPVIATIAQGLPGIDPGGEYLNSACLVETVLGARELLIFLHEIERLCGRDRSREARWGPRTLDLDLLTLGDQVIEEPGLHVPHPRMHERVFVLEPLAAIAPEMVVPGANATVRELLGRLEQTHAEGGT